MKSTRQQKLDCIVENTRGRESGVGRSSTLDSMHGQVDTRQRFDHLARQVRVRDKQDSGQGARSDRASSARYSNQRLRVFVSQGDCLFRSW